MAVKVRNYTDLEVWQLGISLARGVYGFSAQLPREEIYGLVSQMRRAAVSIPSNIAEGHRRHYPKEFVQFLYQALGSLAELETQMVLCGEVYKIQSSQQVCRIADTLGRKLRKLIQALNGSRPSVNFQPPTPNPESPEGME